MDKILLVEDSRPTIDLINTTLTEKGYMVAFALNGNEALITAEKWQPSLILMDILMPEMDGYETCKKLKSNDLTNKIPIIFLSALTKTFDKVKAFKLGGVDFINKPIETDELLEHINTHLKISHLQNELIQANEKLEEKVKLRTAELNQTNIHLQSSLNELFEKSTALSESEERYRTLVNQIMYPVIVSTYDGTVLFMNERTENIFGFEASDIHVYKTIDFWLSQTERQEFIQDMDTIGFVNNKEIKFQKTNKEIITAIVSSSLINYHGQKAILSIFNDITKLKELEQKVLTNTIETEEKERRRFAQELHDGLGPLLSAAKMYLQWITQTEDKDDIPNLLNKIQLLLDEAYETSREISHNLSPHILESFGFAIALKNFIDRSKITDFITVKLCDKFMEFDECLKKIGTQKNTILYRALTECINNTLKHAQADEIKISMEYNEHELEINYSDNGVGFDSKIDLDHKSGLGIFNMKNRIEAIDGSFIINSIPGKGTKIKFILKI